MDGKSHSPYGPARRFTSGTRRVKRRTCHYKIMQIVRAVLPILQAAPLEAAQLFTWRKKIPLPRPISLIVGQHVPKGCQNCTKKCQKIVIFRKMKTSILQPKEGPGSIPLPPAQPTRSGEGMEAPPAMPAEPAAPTAGPGLGREWGWGLRRRSLSPPVRVRGGMGAPLAKPSFTWFHLASLAFTWLHLISFVFTRCLWV